ncbi:hypothetical protein VPH35_038687 [Triticum aestivum]
MGALNLFPNLSSSWVKLIHGQAWRLLVRRAGRGSVSTGHVRKPTMHQHHTSRTPGSCKRIRQSCPRDSISYGTHAASTAGRSSALSSTAMARACKCSPALRLLPNPITAQLPSGRSHGRCRCLAVHAQLPAEDADDYPAESPKRVQVTQSLRRSRRRGAAGRQSLISVGTSRGGGDQWGSDFELTLRQLRLDDLIEDGHSDADVLVHLLVQQHTQFGMSIKGRVVTSLTKICDSCSAPYCTKIDEQFDITVLSSSRKDQSGLPEIGDSDPSVRDIIYLALMLYIITLTITTISFRTGHLCEARNRNRYRLVNPRDDTTNSVSQGMHLQHVMSNCRHTTSY